LLANQRLLPRLVVTGAVERKREKNWFKGQLGKALGYVISGTFRELLWGKGRNVDPVFLHSPNCLPQIPQIIRGKQRLGETTFCSGDEACDEEL
jgi:hypothetical protein